jgi:hypothetical protein
MNLVGWLRSLILQRVRLHVEVLIAAYKDLSKVDELHYTPVQETG